MFTNENIETSGTEIKKNFQALKSELPIYKLNEVFASLPDFTELASPVYWKCMKLKQKWYMSTENS